MAATAELSFSNDLWDGFTVVCRRVQQGMGMCKEICDYFRRRAKIEEDYSKSLLKLILKTKQDELDQLAVNFSGDLLTSGTLGAAWECITRTTQSEANIHANLATQIRDKMGEPLKVKIAHLEDQLKLAVAEGQKLINDQQQWTHTLRKLKKKALKPGPEGQAAEYAYMTHVAQSNAFMQSFLNELMPKVLSKLEDTERIRMQMLKYKFTEFSVVVADVPVQLTPHVTTLSTTIAQIDTTKDLTDFITKSKTDQKKSEVINAEDIRQDEGNKKNFRTWVNKKVGNSLFNDKGGSKTIGPGSSKSYSSIGFPNFQRPTVVSPTPFNFPVFGRSLDAIMKDQKEPLPSMEIPYFLVVLAKDALKAKAPQLEGIFRVAAPSSELEKCVRQFNNGDYNLPDAKLAYISTNLIKRWFRDLPEPLIPASLYDSCIACSNRDEICSILSLLPLNQMKLLVYFSRLLQEFANPENSRISKMDSTNLSLIFSPCFLRSSNTDLETLQKEQYFVQNVIDLFEGERVSLTELDNLLQKDQKLVSVDESPGRLSSSEPIKRSALTSTSRLLGKSKSETVIIEPDKDKFKDNLKRILIKRASENEMIVHRLSQIPKKPGATDEPVVVDKETEQLSSSSSTSTDSSSQNSPSEPPSILATTAAEDLKPPLLQKSSDIKGVGSLVRARTTIVSHHRLGTQSNLTLSGGAGRGSEEHALRRRSKTLNTSSSITASSGSMKAEEETVVALQPRFNNAPDINSPRKRTVSTRNFLRRHNSGESLSAQSSFSTNNLLGAGSLFKIQQNVELMKILVVNEVTNLIQKINNTNDYTASIEISRIIRNVIKCMDNAVSKLSIGESALKAAIGLRPILPIIITKGEPNKEEDFSRLKTLREILALSVNKIIDKVCGLAGRVKYITESDVEPWEICIQEIRSVFLALKATKSKDVTEMQEKADAIFAIVDKRRDAIKGLSLSQLANNAFDSFALNQEIERFLFQNDLRSNISDMMMSADDVHIDETGYNAILDKLRFYVNHLVQCVCTNTLSTEKIQKIKEYIALILSTLQEKSN